MLVATAIKVMTPKFLMFGLVFATLGFQVRAQEQWDTYQPRSLGQIVKDHLSELTDDRSKISFLLTSDQFPSRVKVIYAGKVRIMPPRRKELILEWAKTRRVNKDVVDLFEDELLFVEDSVEYWIPVQKQLLPSFEQELKKGKEVELFLIWIGARKEADNVEWVFLVNEFIRPS